MTPASAAIASALCLASLLSGQRFSSGVDAVRVDALVTEGGRPLTRLVASDFVLLDNGVPQQIDTATLGDVPLSVAIVLDVSGSVAGRTLDRLKDAAGAALDMLTSQDRAALIAFSDEVRVRTDWTSSLAEVRRDLDSLRAGSRTALFDATYTALALDDLPGRRRLILLFSDGADNASWLPRHAVALRARQTDAVVYAVVMNDRGTRNEDLTLLFRSGVQLTSETPAPLMMPPFADELATTTGGRTLRSGGQGELRAAFEGIMREFRSRYILTYMPRGVGAGGWHTIEVKLKRGGGTVTARRGYIRQ